MGLEYPILIGPSVGGFTPNLVIVQEEVNFPMAFYSAVIQDSFAEIFQDLTSIREDFLSTEEGKDYFRWEVTNVQQGELLRQIFYFFESGDWKLMVTFTRPNNAGAAYDELIDEVMQTVKYER